MDDAFYRKGLQIFLRHLRVFQVVFQVTFYANITNIMVVPLEPDVNMPLTRAH